MNAKHLLLVCVVTALFAWLLLKINAARAPDSGAHSSASSARSEISADVLQKVMSSAAVAKPSATPSHPPGENAADIYKNAWVLFNALSDEEKNMLSHPRNKVDADKADALFKKIQPIMDLLRHAKNDATYCDWALGPRAFNTSMPQLNLVQQLGTLAAWDANYLFASDPSSAISDLSVQAQLGHSVGGEALVGFLMENGLNLFAVGLIKDNAATLTPEALLQTREMLSGSFSERDFAQAMANEAEMPRSLAKAISNPQTRKETLDLLIGLSEKTDGENHEDIEAQVQNIQAQAEWLVQMEKNFIQKSQLPDSEFNAWWAKVNENAKGQGLVETVLPVLNAIRNSRRFVEVNRAMLTTGLNILQSGANQLATQHDPTTGQPFTYVATPTGFELRSTFQYKGKPVTMSFPTPAQ